MQGDDRLDQVMKAIRRAEADGDARAEYGLLESLGDIYLASDNYELALSQFERIQNNGQWFSSSHVHRARICYKSAKAHLGLGVLETALRLVARAERLLEGEEEPVLLGRIFSLGGQVNRRIGNHQDALAYSLRALDMLRHSKENREVAFVQLTCGSIFLRQGNYREALRYFSDSLATYRRIDDDEGIAKAYNNIGVASKNLCQWENATDALSRAIEIDHRLGNYAGVALRSLNLGLIRYQTGDWDGATERIEESLQMFRGVKDALGVTLCSLALARIARHERRWVEAKRSLLEALRLSKRHGYRREIAASYEELGALYFSRGQHRTARAFLDQSLQVAREISERNDHIAEVNRRLAEEAIAGGRLDEATVFAKRGLKAAVGIRDKRLIGSGLRVLAMVKRKAGETKLASFYAARSVSIFEASGIPFELGRSLLEAAAVARLNDDIGTARSDLSRAEAIFRRLGADTYSCRVLIEFARLKTRTDRLEDALVLLRKAARFVDREYSGGESEEIRRLRERIEERFVEQSLCTSDRFLVFHESMNGGVSVLPRIAEQLAADGAFVFSRDESGAFRIVESLNGSADEALRTISRIGERWGLPGDVRPLVSFGETERSFLVAPVGGRNGTGLVVERRAGNQRGLFDRRDLGFLLALARNLRIALPAESVAANPEDKGFEGVISRSEKMKKIVDMLRKISGMNATILLQGETGTGKGLLAYEISKGNNAPFVTINCADLTESILESELFGHVKSAFTGAAVAKKGLFEVADGGTVFIDEIDKTSRKFQEKLLRVVDRREFKPVGSVRLKQVDCRIIVASNRDLGELVEKRRFLKDLYYRLKVISIHIPPLRERADDVPLLVEHFLADFSREMDKRDVRFSEEAVDLLRAYHWPGNVRDLQNEVERAVALATSGETLGIDALSEELVAFGRYEVTTPVTGEKALAQMVEELEGRVIRDALRQYDNNKSQVARILGLTRKGLRNKILRYEIDG
ncbi:MAG: sigma 54-interacting transcriptional regulator [Candidatus Eisenbacteria bacterium]|nr:sigma 54-interacting transcriptional regulator [Candidatus Eisenbacteria bacterium]